MKRDYGFTFLAEFLILCAGLLLFRVAARYWGPSLFGEYVLARRTLSFLEIPCLLGLSISIPRYIAAASAGGSGSSASGRYFLAGLAMALGPLAVAGAAFAVAPGPIAALLFGDARYGALLPALYLALIGAVLHLLTYGYFRGHLRMVHANTLQIVNQGLIPLAPFAVRGLDVRSAVQLVGLAWIAVAGLVAGSVVWREWRLAWNAPGSLRDASRDLATYGFPRIAGDLALAALLTLPATLTAHFDGIERAGFVGLSVSVLNMIGSAFMPVGLVMLPAATAMVARGERAALRRSLLRLVGGGIVATTAGVLFLEAVARWLVTWYLGPAFAPAADVLRLVVLGALPYVIYILLRSPIDALAVHPHNAQNLVIGLVAFALVASLWPTAFGVSAALTAGMAVAGALSIRDARVLLRAPQPRLAT